MRFGLFPPSLFSNRDEENLTVFKNLISLRVSNGFSVIRRFRTFRLGAIYHVLLESTLSLCSLQLQLQLTARMKQNRGQVRFCVGPLCCTGSILQLSLVTDGCGHGGHLFCSLPKNSAVLAQQRNSLSRQVAVVTGGTSGIGCASPSPILESS